MKPDGLASYEIAIAALREQGVREGRFAPRDETERRWAEEGPVPVHQLTSVNSLPA